MLGPVINLEQLSELLGDNPARAQEYVDLFLAQTPDRLEEIQGLCASGAWESFSMEVHELKTQLAYLGIEEGTAWAQRLEDICDQGVDRTILLKEWQQFRAYLSALWT